MYKKQAVAQGRLSLTAACRACAHSVCQALGHYAAENVDDDENLKKLRGPQKTKPSPYSIANFLWIASAACVLYYTEFFTTAIKHPKTRMTWLYTGILLICVNLAVAFFLIVYLSYIKKVSSDNWEKQYPPAIPIATACFTFGAICVTVGLWPVWSFLTPFLLFAVFMGVIVIITMLPNF
ncbi:hypothetical protein CAPTEDRAFT_193160 [Capitella teleta]|uniref:Transmembrane protein 128 n=1 Tax=Capitella teleta TaxID=283909 RepID=R7UNI7_CAPTE|nr:hypothetical protein CAPTEDRAFT_193160 [Capitella teleta]|eukprot:ELU07790.1 hypothetical protein CAPTEDRAFT_193160 [Capitella teleta]